MDKDCFAKKKSSKKVTGVWIESRDWCRQMCQDSEFHLVNVYPVLKFSAPEEAMVFLKREGNFNVS